MAITVWKGGAFNMIILYAGLQNIPVELYEAASIDGGSARQKFRYVTLPLMRPVITVLLLLSSMYLMQFFTPIWILTRGGPGFTTTTLSIYIYRIAFERYDFGLASALGTLWFIFLMIATFIILRLSRRRDLAWRRVNLAHLSAARTSELSAIRLAHCRPASLSFCFPCSG